MPVGERLVHRDLVHVFEVASDGHAHGDAGDAQAQGFEEAADVGGGGLALGVGVGGEDDLADLDALVALGAQARQEVREAEVFGAEAAQGRERPVQDVVEAVVAARLLDGDEVVGLLDDADHRAVAPGRGAEAAGLNVGQVVADRAGDDLALDLFERRDEALHVRLRHPQDVEGEPLRRLVPDAGQALELVDQLGDGLGVFEHRGVGCEVSGVR